MDLEIIAHNNLPGNYRLIRVVSETLSNTIQAGDTLQWLTPDISIPYFRHSTEEKKIDFLFYCQQETQAIMTGSLLHAVHLQYIAWPWQEVPKKDWDGLRILYCNPYALGQGLAIALDPLRQKAIDLFLFDIEDACPFKLQPSQLYLPYMQADVTGNIALLEDKKIAARFGSKEYLPGCFHGTAMSLVDSINDYLKVYGNTRRSEIRLLNVAVGDITTPRYVNTPTLIEIICST